MLTKKLILPAAFALAATLSTGCETTTMAESGSTSLAEVQAMAEQALEAANMAQASADANERRMNVMAHEAMKSK